MKQHPDYKTIKTGTSVPVLNGNQVAISVPIPAQRATVTIVPSPRPRY